MGQPQSGTHVRTGFEDAPEVADTVLKHLGTQSTLTGSDAAFVVSESLLACCGVFGQEDVSIGTVGADPQGFVGEFESAFRARFLECPIHEILSLVERCVRGRVDLQFTNQLTHHAFDCLSGRETGRGRCRTAC
jgi:hypothetical protein